MASVRIFHLLPALLLAASGLASGQTAPWTIIESPNPSTSSNHLHGVDALASDDAWAVGYYLDTALGQFQNLAMHWNGSNWTVIPTPNLASPYSNNLKKVAALATNDVWAVGGHGLSFTLHWDGTQWSRIPLPPITNRGSPNVTNFLEDIDAVSPNDIWMVGSMDALNGGTWTLTLHWNGTTWTQVPSPNQPSPSGSFYSQGLDAVVAIAPDDVWAVGYYRVGSAPHPLVLHWNGTQWSIIPAPDGPAGDGWLHGIAAAGPNDIWAVGEYDKQDWAVFAKGLAMHWDGNTWSVSIPPQPSPIEVNPLKSVVARGPNDFYAAGEWSNSSQGLDTFVVHWNGANWNQAPSESMPGPGTGWNQLNDTARAPDGGMWAVGSKQASFGSPTFTLIERADTSGLPSPTPGATPTPTPASTPPPAGTPTPTPISTPTPAATVSPSATPTPTPSATPTPSITPTPTPSPAPATKALNLSTRLRVQTGDNVGIGGFIITGTTPKRVLIRGIGPSLQDFGLPDVLADPVLELHGPEEFVTITNNNWRDGQEVEIEATGIPPAGDLEAAIVATLDPGAYTAILRGNGNTSGAALVEIYDLNQEVASQLANLSTRAFVSTGDSIVIAGFTLGGGPAQTSDSAVVVRGLGPSLAGSGLPNVLSNPTLELRDSNGALLVANEDWQDEPVLAAEIAAAGLAPANELECAIAVTLPPGLYTALLAGLNNATGIGVVEVYDRGTAP